MTAKVLYDFINKFFRERSMKTIVLFASLLVFVCSAVAQDDGPVVGTLDQSLQKKTESLNSQHLVFSPKRKPDATCSNDALLGDGAEVIITPRKEWRNKITQSTAPDRSTGDWKCMSLPQISLY